MLTSNMNFLQHLGNCCRNFVDDSSRNHKSESDHEHAVRSKISDILTSLLRDPSLHDSIAHELTTLVMETNAVHSNVREISKQAAGICTKVYHNVRVGKSLLVQQQRLARNRIELGRNVLRAFIRTTKYSKIVSQVSIPFNFLFSR